MELLQIWKGERTDSVAKAHLEWKRMWGSFPAVPPSLEKLEQLEMLEQLEQLKQKGIQEILSSIFQIGWKGKQCQMESLSKELQIDKSFLRFRPN
jgi:hypothetical protein